MEGYSVGVHVEREGRHVLLVCMLRGVTGGRRLLVTIAWYGNHRECGHGLRGSALVYFSGVNCVPPFPHAC